MYNQKRSAKTSKPKPKQVQTKEVVVCDIGKVEFKNIVKEVVVEVCENLFERLVKELGSSRGSKSENTYSQSQKKGAK